MFRGEYILASTTFSVLRGFLLRNTLASDHSSLDTETMKEYDGLGGKRAFGTYLNTLTVFTMVTYMALCFR